ncbi:MAG: FAD-binding oxidoreductase [Paracoccaceae bacterium]
MLNACTPEFVATLTAALPEGTLRPAEARYLEEPRGRWMGQGGVLAAPRTTDDVVALVRACAAARVGIVPWGGGTGLVGGQLMAKGPAPLILSLERMNRVRAMHADEGVLVVEAGMILADVQKAAADAGRMFPLSLASEGTAQIGGNLAANAGGVNVLRYGNTRDLTLGIEAVLPDGSVLHGLKRMRKDNAGYDLRHLLIGSEGTLGIITAASLRMVARPATEAAALLVVDSPAAALRLLHLCDERLPGMVSALELISGQGLRFLAETMPEVRLPFDVLPDWCVLVDLGLPAALDGPETMAALLDESMETGLVGDGVVAASAAQRDGLWRIRESLPLANRKVGAVSSHDISLPLSEIAGFIPQAMVALSALGEWRVNCFGHLGDGNLHFNVFPMPGRTRADHENQREAVKTCVHDLVHALGGSVAAEHGVGRLKVGDLERYADPAKLAAMRAIKAALDPLGIMNPGAVLRQG